MDERRSALSRASSHHQPDPPHLLLVRPHRLYILRDPTLQKKPAGRQWATEHRPMPPGKKSYADKDVEKHEKRLLMLWEEEDAGKR